MKKIITIAIVAIYMSNLCIAQNDVSCKVIQLTKPGTLGKFIKKNEYGLVKSLQLSGSINQKDLQVLYKLTSIESLDLSNARIEYGTYYEWEDQGTVKRYELNTTNNSGFLLFDNMPIKYLALPNVYQLDVYGVDTLFINELKVPSRDFMLPLGAQYDALGKQVPYRYHKLIIEKNNHNYNKQSVNALDNEKLLSKQQKLHIDTLVIPNIQYIDEYGSDYSILCAISPTIIIETDSNTTYLCKYTDSNTNVSLDKYDKLWENAFDGTNVEEVNCGAIKEIPRECFANCKNLKRVDMPNVESIKDFAFANSSLTRLSAPALKKVSEDAFSLSNVGCIILPSSYNRFYVDAFDKPNFDSIILENPYAPELYHHRYSSDALNHIEFIVPNNSLEKYNIGDWKKLHIRERGEMLNLSIHSDTVGTLKGKITPDMYDKIQSLTISGIMDDLDFAIIRECKFLRDLDLSNCTTYMSAYTAIEELSRMAIYYGLFSAGANITKKSAEEDYKNGNKQYVDAAIQYYQGHAVASALSPVQHKIDSALRYCIKKRYLDDEYYIDKDAVKGLTLLSRISFPSGLVSKVEVRCGGYALRKLVYNEGVEIIGGVENVPNLELIKFPSTLKEIDNFSHVNWEIVDFRNTQLQQFPSSLFSKSPSIKTIYFPNTLLRHRDSSFGYDWTKEMDNRSITYYFLNKDMVFEPYGGSIHIPRGCKAGWTSKCIDDIDW